MKNSFYLLTLRPAVRRGRTSGHTRAAVNGGADGALGAAGVFTNRPAVIADTVNHFTIDRDMRAAQLRTAVAETNRARFARRFAGPHGGTRQRSTSG